MTTKTITHHACKMPRIRSRWKNRIYICKCNNGWTAKYRPPQSDEMLGYYDWHPVEIKVSGEAVYKHG